jgi:sugar phosphate permease
MMGYLGAAAFTALFGVLVTQIGYPPLFVLLAIFDVVAAVLVCVLARQKLVHISTSAGTESSQLKAAAP